MIFRYFPPDGMFIDEVKLDFGIPRKLVRSKLEATYQEDDQMIAINDSNSEAIYQRRDLYQNFNGSEDFFILSYDQDDSLNEVEIHMCDKISVLDIAFDFDSPLDSIISDLAEYSSITEQGRGDYLLRDLKIVVMDKEQMGSEGNSLGYFYCASDISHLEGGL